MGLDSTITMATWLLNASAQPAIREVFKQYFERISKARQEYEDRVIEIPSSQFEQRRQDLIVEINQIQNQAILSVSDQRISVRVLPIIFDQSLATYEARTEQELNVISVNLGQVRGFIDQHRKMMRQRATARWAAVIVSFAAFVFLGWVAFWGTFPGGPSIDTVLPVFQLPLPILLWSVIGSLTAMLYRFNNSGDIELQDPLRWLFTRPLTGIVMGTITFLVVKIGLLAVSLPNAGAIGSTELFSLIAFLSGFSDRFADGLLKSLVGRFGGDAKGDLVNVNNMSSSVSQSDSALLIEALSEFGDRVKQRGKSTKDAITHRNEIQRPAKALPSKDNLGRKAGADAADFKVSETKPNE